MTNVTGTAEDAVQNMQQGFSYMFKRVTQIIQSQSGKRSERLSRGKKICNLDLAVRMFSSTAPFSYVPLETAERRQA